MSEQVPFEGSSKDVVATTSKKIEKMSFEDAMAELETIVQKLERGRLDLESSIQAYERGNALRAHCESKLKQAQMRIEKLVTSEDGQSRLEPLDRE